MKVAVGSDHAGYDGPEPHYKPELIRHLQAQGHEIIDCGTRGPDSVDYPDFARKVCEEILAQRADCGLLICGTGIGISIAANRHSGIRAAVCVNTDMARLSKEHNNANVLCLGRRLLSLQDCKRLLDVWFETPFSGGERHQRRIDKLG